MQATGGIITDNGSYKVHTFSSSGTFYFYGRGTVKALIVGGGGGNSTTSEGWGKGGGGGEVVYQEFELSTGVYSIIVGSGGAAGYDGGSSSGLNLTAAGGHASGISGNGYGYGVDAGGTYGSACGGGGGNASAGTYAYGGPGDYVTSGSGGSGTAVAITGATVFYGCGGAGGRLGGGSQIGGAHGSRVYGDGASGMDQAVQGAYLPALGGVVIISYVYATADSGLRIGDESIVYETLVSTHKLRLNKNGTIVGLPLVDTSSAIAAATRIYDGTTVKSLVKLP